MKRSKTYFDLTDNLVTALLMDGSTREQRRENEKGIRFVLSKARRARQEIRVLEEAYDPEIGQLRKHADYLTIEEHVERN